MPCSFSLLNRLILAAAVAASPVVYADRPEPAEAPLATNPHELPPFDTSVEALPLEQRWSSPEALARHRRVMETLWATRLGQLYLRYLVSDYDRETVPGRAHQLQAIIFEDGDMVGTRLKALHLLSDDIYARGQMTPEIAYRTAILTGVVANAQDEGNDEANRWLIDGALTTAAISLPFGSKLLNQEARRLAEWVAARMTFHRVDRPEVRREELLRWRSFFEGYKLRRAGVFFLKYFGFISMIWAIWLQQKPGWMKYHRTDHKLLNGQDELLENGDV